MKPLREMILQAALVGESSDWEFKSANGGFPGSFWETYCAMANSEGGTIVLGVRELRDGTLQFDGLSQQQINNYKKVLWDTLNNHGKISKNLLSEDDVHVLLVEGRTLLAVHIPRASYTTRPIYIGPTPFGYTYQRRHEGDYSCADDEVRRMLADAEPISADQRILPHFTLDDIDLESLTQYQRRLAALQPTHPWLSLGQQAFMEKLGGWRRDRALRQEGLTVAGLLMFGRYESITDAQAIPHYFVDYREKLDSDESWSHRICPDGTWEANLFQFYQRIWPHLVADLKIPFRLEGMHRQDETPAHKSLREAFVNSMIHSDYREAGGIVIERYLDRFNLENPGTLLVSLEQLLRGGVSECRNPFLQKMFFMIGGGEKAGSGYDRIQSGWRSQHWRPPSLNVQNHPDRVRLMLSMVSLIPDETLAALQKQFGDRLRKLKEPEVQALVTAYLEGEVSNVRLQEVLSNHPADITQILQGLCTKEMLVSDNRRRWARYHLPIEWPKVTSSSRSEQELLTLEPADSSHSEQELLTLEPVDSLHLIQIRKDTKKLAQSIADRIRVPQSEMQNVIYKLCMGRYLDTEYLAKLLNRNPAGLRNRYLTPMVANGLLIMRYPESPNRPDQAYTAKEQKS